MASHDPFYEGAVMNRTQKPVDQQIAAMGCDQDADASLQQQEPLSAADRTSPRTRYREIYKKYWGYYRSLDDGKVDFRTAQVMVMEGYTHEEICDAMHHGSSEIEIRKGYCWADYIESNVRSAEK